MKKLMKIYAKNIGLKNIGIIELNDEIAEEYFIDYLKKEHEKQFYDVSSPEALEAENDDEFNELWQKKYDEIIEKCIEYAKKYKYNDFSSYRIQLVDEDEKIESPDRIGIYTFYDLMK